MSDAFMRLPSKRQYPDYYVMIKKPMSLDIIKEQLDAGEYHTLDVVRQDFEQICGFIILFNCLPCSFITSH